MAWLGYNDGIEDIEKIVQPVGGVFTDTSKPLTISDIEDINAGVYRDINSQLRRKGIEVPVTDTEDIQTLAQINTFLTVEIVEEIRWKTLQNVGQSSAAKKWGDMGRFRLRNFIEGKAFLSENTTQETLSSMIGLADDDIADEDPIFDMDYEW